MRRTAQRAVTMKSGKDKQNARKPKHGTWADQEQ